MPFIVKQGTDDSGEGTKEEYPDLFVENLKRGGYLSRGAAEDLALKLYFVSTPGPFDKNAEKTVSLVGNKQFIGVDDNPSEDEDEVITQPQHGVKRELGYFEQFDHDPTVLQKLRMMRKMKGVLKDDEMGGGLMRLLKASEEKKTWAKHGRRLKLGENDTPLHSFENVMNWALKFTGLYSSDLQNKFVTQIREADAFVGVYERTKEIFERDRNKQAEGLYELAVFYAEQMERYHFQMNMTRDVSHGEGVDQQLKYHEERRRRSILIDSPGSPDIARSSPGGYKGRSGRRRSSASPKSVSVGTVLSPRAQAEFAKGKMKSLGQKLDFIADDRKDDFIRSVDPLSGSGIPGFFAAKGRRRPSISMKANAQPPLTAKPSKGSFQRRSSSNNGGGNPNSESRSQLHAGQREVSFQRSNEPSIPEVDQGEYPSNDPVYIADEDDNLKVDLRSNQSKEPSSPPSKARSKKPPVPRQRIKQSVIDPNKRPVSYSNGTVEDPSTMNAFTKQAMAMAAAKEKAFRAELDTVLAFHREKVKKTHKLAKKGDRKQKAFMARSEDVYEKLQSFDSQVEQEAEKVKLNFEDLEIQYDSSMKIKSEAWGRNKGFKSALTDMKVMARQTSAIENFTKNANLIAPKWFPSFSRTIKELINRAAVLDPIPLSCYQLLMVVQIVTMKGLDLTKERFYAILEATILDKDLLRKVNVHKVLKALRDCIGVRSEEFLRYHEQRDIQPCPELVAHMKATTRKKQRMKQFKQARVSPSNKDASSGLRVIVEGESAIVMDSTLGSQGGLASPVSMEGGGPLTAATSNSFVFSESNLLSPTRSTEDVFSETSSVTSEPTRAASPLQTP